jgi:hypothetical protein
VLARRWPRWAPTALAVVLSGATVVGCGGSHTKTLPWDLFSIEGSTITVRASYGGCERVPQAKVTERPDSVDIKVTTVAFQGHCIDILIETPVVIKLDQPLGKRLVTGCRHPVCVAMR